MQSFLLVNYFTGHPNIVAGTLKFFQHSIWRHHFFQAQRKEARPPLPLGGIQASSSSQVSQSTPSSIFAQSHNVNQISPPSATPWYPGNPFGSCLPPITIIHVLYSQGIIDTFQYVPLKLQRKQRNPLLNTLKRVGMPLVHTTPPIPWIKCKDLSPSWLPRLQGRSLHWMFNSEAQKGMK